MIKYQDWEETVQTLPSVAQKELLDFVGYRQYKHRIDQPGPIVKLGGLWAGIEFDVSDEDVRALRRQVTLQLMDKV